MPTSSKISLNTYDDNDENDEEENDLTKELHNSKNHHVSNINDINYDDDPLFYYEQNKSINFMKRFQDNNDETHQTHLNEIEATLNSLSLNQQKPHKNASNHGQLDLDFLEDENESVKHYSHLDNLNYEDFNDDNENMNDIEGGDDEEDDLGYFNLNK